MRFTYETQGTITYLVCELDATEQVDSLTLGMLTNNHISGVAPVLYTEMNGQKYLKYNISAKVSVDHFFSGTITKQRALTVFGNILNAICSADDYMIDPNCFSVAAEHIFLNVSSCETALICVPVVSEKNINSEAAALFKRILFTAQFDNSEDVSYITQLITYINNTASFTVYGLKDLVTRLQSGAVQSTPVTPAVQPQPAPRPVASVSSFDSTISINEMPPYHEPVQPVQQPKPQPQTQPRAGGLPVSPVRPMAQSNVSTQPSMPVSGRPITGSGVQIPTAGRAPQPKVGSAPSAPAGPGFAIPGQSGIGSAPRSAPAKAAKKVEDSAEKKMSFLGLLSHYNKENAELYKKQKEDAKAQKASAKSAKKAGKPEAVSIPGSQSVQQPGGPGTPVAPSQPQYAVQQYQSQPQPAARPMPVQNCFNETTVLSPMMVGGETTVLSAEACAPNPCLVRVRNGERISINKPVFRIGKEKSYVDYFIADNTAISRSHANIHTENGEYYIEDTNSTNHTYVNGRLINSNVKTKITDGDKIRLANEDFTFTI